MKAKIDWTPNMLEELLRMHKEGTALAAIADKFGISLSATSRKMRELRQDAPGKPIPVITEVPKSAAPVVIKAERADAPATKGPLYKLALLLAQETDEVARQVVDAAHSLRELMRMDERKTT